jgi:hypothetical protein
MPDSPGFFEVPGRVTGLAVSVGDVLVAVVAPIGQATLTKLVPNLFRRIQLRRTCRQRQQCGFWPITAALEWYSIAPDPISPRHAAPVEQLG